MIKRLINRLFNKKPYSLFYEVYYNNDYKAFMQG